MKSILTLLTILIFAYSNTHALERKEYVQELSQFPKICLISSTVFSKACTICRSWLCIARCRERFLYFDMRGNINAANRKGWFAPVLNGGVRVKCEG